MKVYIDESGTFSRADDKEFSLSCVGILFIPHNSFEKLIKKYERLRLSFPKTEKGEVKGKSLSENQISQVIDLLRRNNCLFEAAMIDLNVQNALELQEARKTLRDNHTKKMSPEGLKKNEKFLKILIDKMDKMSMQLLVQFMLTTELVHRALQNAIAYYSQRFPQDIGNFEWYFDAKEKDSITTAESWWRDSVGPFLAAKSKVDPAMHLPVGDYSYYELSYKTSEKDIETGETFDGTDLEKMFSNFVFSSDLNYGLELVDIVTNTLRRAVSGNLQEDGWGGLPDLMIRWKNKETIPMIIFSDGKTVNSRPSYARTYKKIAYGRKEMITRSSWEFIEMGSKGSK